MRNLEQMGVSDSIARKSPLQGQGEVDSSGHYIVSTWGDFASRLHELYPELTTEQVFQLLGITSDPYEGRATNRFGDPLHTHEQNTINNPNTFSFRSVRSSLLCRYEHEARAVFKEEKGRLCGEVDRLIESLKHKQPEQQMSIDDVERIIEAIATDEQYRQAQIARDSATISYDDVAGLEDTHHQRRQYYQEQHTCRAAQEVCWDYEERLAMLARQLKSMQDFDVAISLYDFAESALRAYKDIEQGEWDMRKTWLRAVNEIIESLYRQGMGALNTKDIFIVEGDIDMMKETIQMSQYELRQYAEACWQYILPIGKARQLEGSPLVRGGEK